MLEQSLKCAQHPQWVVSQIPTSPPVLFADISAPFAWFVSSHNFGELSTNKNFEQLLLEKIFNWLLINPGEFLEHDYINAPFSALDFGNIGLRPIQHFGDRNFV